MNSTYLEAEYGQSKLKEALIPGAFFGLFILFLTLFALIIGALMGEINAIRLLLLLGGGVLVSALLFCLINKSVLEDLNSKEIDLVYGVVQKKRSYKEGIAGSGMLYIPILGDLFPSVWGHNMVEVQVYSLIINNKLYIVSQELYSESEIGMNVCLHFSKKADVLLDIKLL